MRTIRFYSNAKGQTWLSPTRLMAAIRSREPIRFIDHTTAIAPQFQTAFDGAIQYLRKLVSVKLWQNLFNLMMITGVLGVLRHPVVMGKLPSPIPETVFVLVAVFTIICLAQILQFIVKYADFEFRRRKLFGDGLPHIWRALERDPPPMAHRIKKLARPKTGWAAAFFVAVCLLNMLVIATPYRVALMPDGEVVETFRIVPLGTQWTMRQRYPDAVSVGYFFGQGAIYTWLHAEYSVEYLDLTYTDVDFKVAMGSYLQSVTGNISNYVSQNFGPDMTETDQLNAYLEYYNDPDNMVMIERWFRVHFNRTFDGVLAMRNLKITVRTGSVQELRKWLSQ